MVCVAWRHNQSLPVPVIPRTPAGEDPEMEEI